MYKKIMVLTLALLLTSCSLFHIKRLEVEQGNIITPEMVGQIHKGMTDGEVRRIMGNPVTLNIFTPNRMEYVYTYQLGDLPRSEHRLTLIFAGGKIANIIQD
jgi:outer membrane protein assembly factor BamE